MKPRVEAHSYTYVRAHLAALMDKAAQGVIIAICRRGSQPVILRKLTEREKRRPGITRSASGKWPVVMIKPTRREERLYGIAVASKNEKKRKK